MLRHKDLKPIFSNFITTKILFIVFYLVALTANKSLYFWLLEYNKVKQASKPCQGICI